MSYCKKLKDIRIGGFRFEIAIGWVLLKQSHFYGFFGKMFKKVKKWELYL